MPPPRRFDARERRALVAIFLAAALASLDISIANTALPAIAASMRAPPADSIWVVNAYQLSVVAVLLPFAALGDRIGARTVYLGGMALFATASLACALAPTLPTLALARVVQGVGGGALMSVNIALVRKVYPPEHLGRGVGLNALAVGLAFSLGPTVASLVLAVATWPWLFAINVPIGALAFAFAWNALPRDEPARRQRLDPLTAVLTAVTFATLIFALSAAAQRTPWTVVTAALAVTLVAGALVLRRQAGDPAPMLPVDLLRRPLFALSAVTATGAFTTQGLAFVALPFFFQGVLQRPPVETGFLILPWAAIVALAAPFAGRLSERYPPGALGGAGLALLALGMAALAALPADASVANIVWRMALCGAGFSLFQSPNLNALMSSAPPERSGGASGVIALARLIGQALGAALVALCFGLAGAAGPTWALGLGAAFAAAACATSTARLWAR